MEQKIYFYQHFSLLEKVFTPNFQQIFKQICCKQKIKSGQVTSDCVFLQGQKQEIPPAHIGSSLSLYLYFLSNFSCQTLYITEQHHNTPFIYRQ